MLALTRTSIFGTTYEARPLKEVDHFSLTSHESTRAAWDGAGGFVRRQGKVVHLLQGPCLVRRAEDRGPGQRQHAVARGRRWRRRGDDRAVTGRQLRRAEHHHRAVTRAAAGQLARDRHHDVELAEPGRALHAGAYQS